MEKSRNTGGGTGGEENVVVVGSVAVTLWRI